MPIKSGVKKILGQQKLAPKKKLGQNFLVHPHTAARIVQLAEIGAEDVIVELGVGLGALTSHLAASARRVIGIELDAGIVRWHEEEKVLPETVSLLHQDMLEADFFDLARQGDGRLKIVANLPYSVSSPLLIKVIEHREIMDWAVLMLQKEVGMRLVASPGSKDYSTLTVLVGACATVQTLLTVGPGEFHPRPKVDSVVVRLRFQPPPERLRHFPPYDRQQFRNLVRAAFQQRRKTLLNALSASAPVGLPKTAVQRLLECVGIDLRQRAENLTVEDYIRLTLARAELGI